MERFARKARGFVKGGSNPGFVKGQSGNPGGRPKEIRALKELAREHTPEAIEELARLSLHARQESTRLAAIRELLDRGYGKPVPADSPVMGPAAEQRSSVVYVPYQCETMEQWEREAQAWLEIQKRRQEELERQGIDPFALPPITEQRH